jgi:ribonuclease-3
VAFKEVNFKSKLLEWSQKNRVRLEYKLTKQKKDENGSPVFTYMVQIEGVNGESGSGYSKKEAQQKASKDTLQRLKREPQFVDAVFAAKTARTQMEEEPAMAVPDPEKEQQNFIIEQEDLRNEESGKRKEDTPTVKPDKAQTIDFTDKEFDLSDISHKEKSREEIIAEAEAAAFSED